ncbi:SET domain-containing protein [Mycena venus]|uniref:SET domain-containing protein n=1 Tax=Mycena venus TaxID=2733690 RepID=A0A8H7DAD7_9AGAR|nr:SET domain-containing protein [Mycena venus]
MAVDGAGNIAYCMLNMVDILSHLHTVYDDDARCNVPAACEPAEHATQEQMQHQRGGGKKADACGIVPVQCERHGILFALRVRIIFHPIVLKVEAAATAHPPNSSACLDAAANNLAQLIIHLNSEAMPGTPSGPWSYCPEGQMAREGKSKTCTQSSHVHPNSAGAADHTVAHSLPAAHAPLHNDSHSGSQPCTSLPLAASLPVAHLHIALVHDVLFSNIAPPSFPSHRLDPLNSSRHPGASLTFIEPSSPNDPGSPCREHFNLIALDHPIGVGASYGTHKSIILAGGSYGGTYVPHIATVIHEQNIALAAGKGQPGVVHINLETMMVSNPLSDATSHFGWLLQTRCYDVPDMYNASTCADCSRFSYIVSRAFNSHSKHHGP